MYVRMYVLYVQYIQCNISNSMAATACLECIKYNVYLVLLLMSPLSLDRYDDAAYYNWLLATSHKTYGANGKYFDVGTLSRCIQYVLVLALYNMCITQ